MEHTISGHGLTARFLEMGAILRDLRLEGHDAPLVLGLEDAAHYPEYSQFMGATAGRCANRIGGARFVLDGAEHELSANFRGRHTLHGGAEGTGKLRWRLAEKAANVVRFEITLADGHMGFPGRIEIAATFACTANATLRVDYEATCDASTLCNLAHHSYWVLDDTGGLDHHRLQVAADRYVPVDDDLIPTGVASVEGTRFDYREGRGLPDREGLLDHNLCLASARGPLREVAELRSEASNVAMRIATTEAGLQVYDGANLDTRVPGLGGRRYAPHAGIALEPQAWPDGIHHEGFPNTMLRPGERYRQTSTFRFLKG
ncbi:aldose epimerase family protein [Jannaschia sp. W003]|uniref:aldose epimerase family protein n=1 Tax=Jannaschia sp. W003 TaxID=2867012 RepID=UPI0021A3C48A|nr:aldose epimerase family protein [Jannaschia sp. W003]UWQ22641.1 galactose mutarotase [Jannaschia sp. W003]